MTMLRVELILFYQLHLINIKDVRTKGNKVMTLFGGIELSPALTVHMILVTCSRCKMPIVL